MNVLTNREIYYNLDEKDGKTGFFKRTGDKLKNLEKNQLFQTGAAAYGSYLQQRYQGGGFQPLSTSQELGTTNNEQPTVFVSGNNELPPKKMSTGLKIGIGVGVAAVIGIIIFVVVKNKNKGKK